MSVTVVDTKLSLKKSQLASTFKFSVMLYDKTGRKPILKKEIAQL